MGLLRHDCSKESRLQHGRFLRRLCCSTVLTLFKTAMINQRMSDENNAVWVTSFFHSLVAVRNANSFCMRVCRGRPTRHLSGGVYAAFGGVQVGGQDVFGVAAWCFGAQCGELVVLAKSAGVSQQHHHDVLCPRALSVAWLSKFRSWDPKPPGLKLSPTPVGLRLPDHLPHLLTS